MFDDPMKYGYICHIIVILLLIKISNAYEKEFVFYSRDGDSYAFIFLFR